MNFINTVLGIPLGYIFYGAYYITDNFGLSIILFALVIRIVLFPVNIITHKNSIRYLQLQKQLCRIKHQYAGDKEGLSAAQYDLFKKEKYNPFMSLAPLIIQLVVLIGVLQVMYHPMQHLLHLDSGTISSHLQTARGMFGQYTGAGEQLHAIKALGLIDLTFFGINTGAVPSLQNFAVDSLIPVLSGISALIYCLVQNKYSPGAISQTGRTNIMLTAVTVGFSVYFAAVVPAGVGMYWIFANVFSIGVILLLELMYSPSELAVEAVAFIKSSRKTKQQIKHEKDIKKQNKYREKQDAEKFAAAKKELVFYALSDGQYKYYEATINYILEHSDIVIHYLTNDPGDAVFKKNSKKLIPYYAGEHKTISLLLKLDADIMVTTVESLQVYHMKRSVVRDDIEYIHMMHGVGSSIFADRESAFDYFDTLFCTGPHQIQEVRRREEITGLRKKRLVKGGYGLYDQLVISYNSITGNPSEDSGRKPQVLIAPSWQNDCILDICIEPMLESLFGNGFRIILRPHPQFRRLLPERLDELTGQYQDYIDSGELVFDFDFLDSSSIYLSDILITDWSNIAYEFSFCTLKPCIFINTPMKIMNPNYKKYGMEILDLKLRNELGISVEVSGTHKIGNTVKQLLADKEAYKEKIEQVVKQCIYHPGRSGEAGGKYIIEQIQAYRRKYNRG